MTSANTTPLFSQEYETFLQQLDKSPLTVQAYAADIRQFLTYLSATDVTITKPDQVTRSLISEYLASLAAQGRTGTTRARKLISLQVFFQHLVHEHRIPHSPAATISRPKAIRRSHHFLRPEEYTRLLAEAGAHVRDFAILQVFLQTGIRVSELIAICRDDLDMDHKELRIHGKGEKERVIPLEKKAMQALKSYLSIRPECVDTHVFLSYQGKGFSIRGVRKLVEKYLKQAGITKQISCHGLRRTCLSTKAARNMNAFAIQALAGHARMETTKLYVQLGTEDLRPMMEATSL